MKILLVVSDIALWGGVNRVVANLANALSGQNIRVDVLSIFKNNQSSPFNMRENIDLIFLHNEDQQSFHRHRKSKNIFKSFYTKSIQKRLDDMKIKKIANDYDIAIFNNYFLYNPYFKNKKTRYVKILHGQFSNYTSKDLNRDKFFDTIILLSGKQINDFQKYFKNIKIIPNFINMPLDIADRNQKIVLSVGRMSKDNQKGFLRLIDIWEIIQKNPKNKDWKLKIVGEGELQEKIINKIKDKNLENSIIIKPFTKEIDKEYLNATIYVMTSHFEGFPMVLLESSSYGLPLVAFDINTGPSDIIEDGKNGFLIKDNDLQEFSNKLQILIDSKKLRKEMGVMAKKITSEKFSKEVVIKEWINL
ncbi:glycosyltransferase family 4 protein [Campylobacter coli]|nr:glycosyltransferase family 4 protein [Campylobacter coli]